MRTIKYRAEIDGLRAISVLGVILFHAKLGLSGGYIGVDVFFVISGFLISGIIIKELEENRFSLINFWHRRIRRIVPAVTFLVFIVILVALVILDNDSFRKLGQSAIAQSTMLSNVYFWITDDYFAQASELKPLLHTWSLSVEEQFYIFFPFVLILLSRFKKNIKIVSIVVLFLVSFVLSLYLIEKYPGATFYLLPTRAWELIAGCLAAMYINKIKFNKLFSEILSLLGIILILIPMFLYTSETLFPGLAALPPVLGAVLFILSTKNHNTFVRKLLSLKYVVFIGVISYSLYLWHWPILVFSHHLFIEISSLNILIMMIMTFLLSFLSWKFVEKPFVNKTFFKNKSNVFKFGIGANLIVLVFGVLIWKMDGFPQRFDKSTLLVMEDTYWHAKESEDGILIGATNKPSFVLWGDSHAMAVSKIIDELAKTKNISGVSFLSSGTPPVIGLWKPMQGDVKKKTLEINNKRLKWILENNIKNLILVARWNGMITGFTDAEMTVEKGKSKMYPMVIDNENKSLSISTSALALKTQLEKMINILNKNGVNVYILKQVPSALNPQVSKSFLLKYRFPELNNFDVNSTSNKIRT